VATDLPLGHAAHELGPGVLRSSERHTRFGGIVEELIVLNPEGSVPGFVVCPTVVGGHGSVRLVWNQYKGSAGDQVGGSVQ